MNEVTVNINLSVETIMDLHAAATAAMNNATTMEAEVRYAALVETVEEWMP